ncbi:serine/threonine-protein kinase [Butyrivibrio sp. NC2002]|uniref:serine/threonine-protein kinase n=1 Tax=Butyrivibrio sp. NC2002 TaxID=1410610 RepID=UPI000565CEBA|nr:serine/threonine-protein kinase [Butyrivibrio sp. NC2002]
MLEIGSVFDKKYKILNVIGQGGMSTVYLAMNERAGKSWAIKEIRKEGVSDYRVIKQSLITEVSLLRNLSHPYIPTIADVIDKEDSIVIVMDYIEGNNLKKALDEYGSFSEEYVIEWAKQLCDVLMYLHTRTPKIIYRDLKPGNIMLRPDGSICLIDFGTAREYKEQGKDDTICLGTRGYAAPEQFGGLGQTDERTDIYCLGTTMYHLLTGHNPSEPPYEIKPIRQWNPDFSQGLERIILKCTEPNPENRYSSCEEVLYDLKNYTQLDQKYRKKAKRRIGTFAVTASLSLMFAAFSLLTGKAASNQKIVIYDDYVDQAKIEVQYTDKMLMYIKAIDVDPSKAEAYLKIINEVYLTDDNYSQEEDKQLTDILLTTTSDGRTRGEALESNPEEFAEFAYYRGLTYFYSYENDGNKTLSSYWFNKAVESGMLDEVRNERAVRLGRISDYYLSIGRESKSGDEIISYKQYWNDLCDLTSGNIVSIDNETTALMMYEELAGQVNLHAMEFIKGGVSYDSIRDEFEMIESHLDSDFNAETMSSSERLTTMMENTKSLLDKAKASAKNAHNKVREEPS